MNRNFFDKPLQGGGRDAWDYGHTGRFAAERAVLLDGAAMLAIVSSILIGAALIVAMVMMP